MALATVVAVAEVPVLSPPAPLELEGKITRFDPRPFLGPGWQAMERDWRSFDLSAVDFTRVVLDRLNWRETWPWYHPILLNAWIGGALYREKKNDWPTLEWLRLERGIENFDFPGTVLFGPNGRTYSFCLFWEMDWWHYYSRLIRVGENAGYPSAVLLVSATGDVLS